MRGRTNIPPRKKPVINGELKNFVVASGNTIRKGDFVSVVRHSGAKTLSNVESQFMYKCQYDVVNKKTLVVARQGSSVCAFLLHNTSLGIEILNQVTLNAYSYFDFNASTNSLYCYAGNGIIQKYSVINDELVRQNNLDISASYPNTIVGIAVFGNDENVAVVYTQNSSYGYVRIYSKVNNVYQIGINEITVGYYPQGIKSGNNLFVVLSKQSASGSYYFYKFSNYSFESGTIDKSSVECIIDAQSNMNFRDIEIINNNLYYALSIYSTVLSSWGYFLKFQKYNLSDMTVEFTYAPTQGFYTGGFWNVNYVDENTFILSTTSRYQLISGYGTFISALVMVTKNEQGVYNTINENFDTVTCSGGSILFVDDDQIKLGTFSIRDTMVSPAVDGGIYEYTFEIADDTILLGEPTGYVMEYDSKKALGFANTSGNAGSVVQVFVPPTPQTGS